MQFRLIVFDLDETLWTIDQHAMGPIRGPFELQDRQEAVGKTATITLRVGVRALLAHLHGRDVKISLASRLDPDVCEELLRIFEIDRYFAYPQYGWQSKGEAVLNVIQSLRTHHDLEIRPEHALFIDDYPANCDSVRQAGASSLQFGRDVRSIQELLVVLGGS